MPKRQNRKFTDLTWDDLEEWAGSKIVARGRDYQKHGHVSELAITKDKGLIAWVRGSDVYATKVVMDNDGLPVSDCTCPYQFDCKHGVAVILEYIEKVKKKKSVPLADKKDERFRLLEEGDEEIDNEDDGPLLQKKDNNKGIDAYLKAMTKEKLITLIHELSDKIPEITGELIDRQQMQSKDKRPMIDRLRKEIKEIACEPNWQDYWNHEGYTPDYSGILNKLKALLAAGYADDILSLGKELMSSGSELVGMSDDNGETAMDIEKCVPVIIKALEGSSLSQEEKLAFAIDSLIDDSYSMFEGFSKYVDRKHPVDVWSRIADSLINRLKNYGIQKESDSSRNYKRDRISNWAICALENVGRVDEIIPLCESEAKKTGSYTRLVKRLIEDKRYENAETWIHKGIEDVGNKWPGIAADLRGALLNIRAHKRDWHAVAAINVYEFIQHPSDRSFLSCKKPAEKVKLWPDVRKTLLTYLENGALPWKQKSWPLPEPVFEHSKSNRWERFPMFGTLIDIAILEKRPELVLEWYDKIPKNGYGLGDVGLDKIATAIKSHAPERAVSMWKRKAEHLIAQVNPKAYKTASIYLKKAQKVMADQNRQKEWDFYIIQLRKEHKRKTKFIEVLGNLKSRPIIQIK